MNNLKPNSKEKNDMKKSPSNNTVILTTTAATIDPKNHEVQTVVVPNENGNSQDDPHPNIILNCNQGKKCIVMTCLDFYELL